MGGIIKKIKTEAKRVLDTIKKYIYVSKYSIRYNTIWATILMVLIPMSFSFFYLYDSINTILKGNAENNLMNMVNSISNDLYSQFENINDTSLLFISNTTIRSILKKDTGDNSYIKTQKKVLIEKELQNSLLFNYVWDKKILKSVFIYEDPNSHYFISRDFYSKIIVKKSNHISEKIFISENGREILPPDFSDWTVYFARPIRDLNTHSFLGALVLGIDVDEIIETNYNKNSYKNMKITVFDDDGIIYYDKNKTKLGNKIGQEFMRIKDTGEMQNIKIDDIDCLVTSMKIANYGFRCVVAVPEDEVFNELRSNMINYLIPIIFLILFFLVLGVYISSKVVAPIKIMTETSKEIKEGNFQKKLMPSKYIELNELNTAFNKAMDEIDYLIYEVYEKQLLLKESEMAMLEAQVNPHFLFNVLENVGWEAMFSGNTKIYEMTTALGQLIRSSMVLGNSEKITIGEEIEYIEMYLKLQKMRFEDKLSYDICVEDSIKKYYIPKLCMLPIVENSIIHGIEAKRDGGYIKISSKETLYKIALEVRDNGVGFDTTKLNIEHSDRNSKKEKHTNIGMYNSNRRIKLMYGMEYGLLVESQINKGTKVTAYIPKDRGDKL